MIPETFVPVDLKPGDHWVLTDGRIGGGQRRQGIQLLLNVAQVCGGAVIPAVSVPDTQKRTGFPAGFVLSQSPIFIHNGGLEYILQADIGI